MKREYQYGFSRRWEQASFNSEGRIRKARTILAILRAEVGPDLCDKRVIDIGASTGFIAGFLADYVESCVAIDIDEEAIAHARSSCTQSNLEFKVGDAMQTGFEDGSFDIVLCNHIYEHVPDDQKLLAEISRILVDDGFCYFTAGNRFQVMEPHYRLPLLSVIPTGWAHYYLMATGNGSHYYERHRSYWGLRNLVKDFDIVDYTKRVITRPDDYETQYMIPQGSIKQLAATFISKYLYFLVPTYIWVLKKSCRKAEDG
jgi:ubiquinone/menaquinone biosynthesis C-methylase UbiE